MYTHCHVLFFSPTGALSDPEDTEAIVHGMGPLRLTSRYSAAAAPAVASLPTPTSTTVKIPISTPSSMPHERKGAAAVIAAPSGASGGAGSRGQSATHPGFDSVGVGGRGSGRAGVAVRGDNREVRGSGNAGGSGSTGGSVTVGGGPVTSSGNKGSGKSRIGGRGMIPPPIETRPMPNLADEGDLASGRR